MTIFCYQHHINDWRTDTAGLSLEQRGAYREMMDWFYALEGKLPSDVKKLHRLVGAQTRREKEAVNFICARFWQKNADFLSQKRSETELLRIKEKQKKASQSAKNRYLASANAHANAHANAMLTNNQEPIKEKKEDKSSFQKNEEPPTTQMPKLIFDEETKVKNVKRKSALKDDWKPNDNHRAKCAERGLDAGKLCEEFRNYHLARGNLFADWDRAFFTWIGNAERFGGGKAIGGAGKQRAGNIIEAGLRVAARYKNQD